MSDRAILGDDDVLSCEGDYEDSDGDYDFAAEIEQAEEEEAKRSKE